MASPRALLLFVGLLLGLPGVMCLLWTAALVQIERPWCEIPFLVPTLLTLGAGLFEIVASRREVG